MNKVVYDSIGKSRLKCRHERNGSPYGSGLITIMSLSLLPSWVNHKTDENVTAHKALYDVNGSLPVLVGTVLLSVILAFAFRRMKGVEGIIPGASQNDNSVNKLKERPYGGNLYVQPWQHIS